MHSNVNKLRVFDVDGGLYRIGGSRDLYVELLCDFVESFSDAAVKYRALILEDDKEPARRLVHSVKGVAGNLGCLILHKAALELERAVRTYDFPLAESLVPLFEKALDDAVHDIRDSGILDGKGGRLRDVADRDGLIAALNDFSVCAGNGKAKSAAVVLRKLERFEWPEDVSADIREILSLSEKYKLKEAAQKADCIRVSLRGYRDVYHE